MGWAIMLALAAATFVALWRFGRMPRGGLELLGAALFVGIAGYAWQGSPGLAGSPTAPGRHGDAMGRSSPPLQLFTLARVGGDSDVLAAAENLRARGDDLYAIGTIKAALARRPRSADLWAGLGSAFVSVAEGNITPAARLAFQRAADIQPEHPAPPFYLAMSIAQAGQFDQAEQILRGLLVRTPEDAPWRPLVEEKLGLVNMLRAQQGGASPAMGGPQ